MPDPEVPARLYRFGAFELDERARLLRKHGVRLHLQQQPMRILLMLLQQPGAVVPREQIQRELWPGDTHVEFDSGLNAAVKRLRAVLGDSADNPRFVETIPKQGYRFVAPLEVIALGGEAAGTVAAAEAAAEVEASRAEKTALVGEPARSWRGAGMIVLGATAVLVILGAMLPWWRAAPEARRPLRMLTVDTGQPALSPALSPDGQWIAYFASIAGSSQHALYLRNLAETEPKLVGGFAIPHLHQPAWSPDSRAVAAILKAGMLFKVDVASGKALPVAPLPEATGYQAQPLWSPYAVPFVNGWVLEESSAKMRPLFEGTQAGPNVSCADASWVPFRQWFFCGGRMPNYAIRLLDARGQMVDTAGLSRRDYDFGARPLYSPTGHLIYRTMDSLWAIRLEGETLEPVGAPFRLAADASSPSLSLDGDLLYRESTGQQQQLAWVNRQGEEVAVVGPAQGAIAQPTLDARSGRILWLARADGTEQWSIWLYDPHLGLAAPEVVDREMLDRPVWVPGGERFTFTWKRAVYVKRIQRPQVTAAPFIRMDRGIAWVREWCPDGSCVLYSSASRNGADIWMRERPESKQAVSRAYMASPQDETSPAISPDGRYIAYQAKRQEQVGVYLNTFPAPSREILVAANGGQPQWRADGKELFFVRDGRWMMALPVRTEPDFTVTGEARMLFEHAELGPFRVQEYAVSPDGERFLVVKTVQSPRTVLRLVENWSALLP